MTKKIILDTNILMADASALKKFKSKKHDIEIILLDSVLRELDKHKTSRNKEHAFVARDAIRQLDDIIGEGDLMQGIPISKGVTLRSGFAYREHIQNNPLPDLEIESQDDRILQAAYALTKTSSDVELVTNDLDLRIRAKVTGVKANKYKAPKKTPFYSGRREFYNANKFADQLEEKHSVKPSDIDPHLKLFPNEYISLYRHYGSGDDPRPVIGRYDARQKLIIPLYQQLNPQIKIGVNPRNPRQAMAVDAIYNPDVRFVFLIGPAGTAKTYLSIDGAIRMSDPKAAGVKTPSEDAEGGERLEQWRRSKKGQEILRENHVLYDKIALTRPRIAAGPEKDIGALPGDLADKYGPWLMPFVDNARIVLDSYRINVQELDYMFLNKLIEQIPLDLARGRSLNHVYWCIDEAQNIPQGPFKMLLTRIGKGTKVIFGGDPTQNDLGWDFENTPLHGFNYQLRANPYTATITFGEEDIERGDDVIRKIVADLEGPRYEHHIKIPRKRLKS